VKYPLRREPAPSFAQEPAPSEIAEKELQNETLRVIVQEVPAPGSEPELQPTSFEDTRSIAAARKSRPGG